MRKFLQTFGLLATFIKVGHKNFMYSGYWVLIGFLLPFHPHSVVNFPSRFIKIVACLLGKSKGRKQAHFLFFSLARYPWCQSLPPIFIPILKWKAQKRSQIEERGALGLFVVVFSGKFASFFCACLLSLIIPQLLLWQSLLERRLETFSLFFIWWMLLRVCHPYYRGPA